MKRMLKMLLALFSALMLLSSAALAETPAYGPELAAERLAIPAMYDKYAFTPKILGLFTITTTVEGKSARVRFTPTFLPLSRVGEYEVDVNDSKVEAHWTHDDKDAALWASGEPECPYWGVKQLRAYLDSEDRRKWHGDFNADTDDPSSVLSVYDKLDFTVSAQEPGDLPARQAYQLARDAIMDVYCMSAEEVGALENMYDMDHYLLCSNGQRLLELTISSYDLCFHVLIDAQTHEVCWILLYSGGNG